MNIQMDLVLPPIIVGTLILLILGLNRLMMESGSDARLSKDMQQFANTALLVLQEELRDLDTIVSITDSTLTYRAVNTDTIRIFQDDREMILLRSNAPASLQDTTRYAVRLANLRFVLTQLDITGPFMLNVTVTSESLPQEAAGINPPRYRAFATRDFYLRNLDLN